jgi:hypothetical protein
MSTSPTTDDLRAYMSGQLTTERFVEVERWLDAQSPETVERLLEESRDEEAGVLANVKPTTASGFIADGGAGRLRPDGQIGVGGMAVVAAARDRALDRVVALKSLKVRQADESLEQYHLREAAFRREAALTVNLHSP